MGDDREIYVLASLVSDAHQVIVENVELTVNFICQPSAPHVFQDDPGPRSDCRLVLLVLWYTFWVVVAFFLHIFIGRYLSQPQNGTGRGFQKCLYRIPMGQSRVGLGSPSISGEASSLSQLPNVRARRTYLSGPVRSQSHRRAPQDQDVALNLFEPRSAETTPLSATLLAWTTLPTSPSSDSTVAESRPADSTGVGPLFATLYPRSGGLPVASSTKWFILVVAVTWKEYGVVDPKFDLAFLQKVFAQSKSMNVRLEWLAEGDATLENIQAKLVSLRNEAQNLGDAFRVCVYFTGMGNGDSKMCLFGNEVVSEQELGGWTVGTHLLPGGSQSPSSLGAVFDFCREAMKPRDLVDPSLGVVWSSRVGEPPSAYAYPLGDGLPISCFLIAIFSAAHDTLVGSNTFEEAIQLRLERFGEFLLFRYRKRHEVNGRCNECNAQGEKCLPPTPQLPEWDSAGLSMLAALGDLIKTEYSGYAFEVSEALARKMEERGFTVRSNDRQNDQHLPDCANQASSIREVRSTTSCFRGVNKRTSQIV